MESEQQHSAASVRAVEIGVAVVIFLFGALVVFDSYRLGADGRRRAASRLLSFLCRTVDLRLRRSDLRPCFAKHGVRSRIVRVARGAEEILPVLVPTVVYVALIAPLGFYLASTLYIAYFMCTWAIRRIKIAAVSIGVSVAFFLIFEIWFSVPLPKGPLEAALGLN